jgi:hypothetical protein
MGLEPAPEREALVLYLVRKGDKIDVSHTQILPRQPFPMQYVRTRGNDGVPLTFYYRILGARDRELYIGSANDTTGRTAEHPTLERGRGRSETPGLARVKSTQEVSHFFLTIPYFEEASAVEIYGSDMADEKLEARLLVRIGRAEWQ